VNHVRRRDGRNLKARPSIADRPRVCDRLRAARSHQHLQKGLVWGLDGSVFADTAVGGGGLRQGWRLKRRVTGRMSFDPSIRLTEGNAGVCARSCSRKGEEDIWKKIRKGEKGVENGQKISVPPLS